MEKLTKTQWQSDREHVWTYRSWWDIETPTGKKFTKNKVEGLVLHYHDGTYRTFLGKDPHPMSYHSTKEAAWEAVEQRLREAQNKRHQRK